MKVVVAPDDYELQKDEISVFLAGGITNCPQWQTDTLKSLGSYVDTDKLVVFNPRRDNFPIHDKSESYRQIEWEFKNLERADIFSMYFCSGISDQPICMYELGRNIVKMQMRFPIDWKKRIIVSVEDGYKRKQDVLIQTELSCGAEVFVNTQIDSSLCHYHAGSIINSYKKIKYGR